MLVAELGFTLSRAQSMWIGVGWAMTCFVDPLGLFALNRDHNSWDSIVEYIELIIITCYAWLASFGVSVFIAAMFSQTSILHTVKLKSSAIKFVDDIILVLLIIAKYRCFFP